MSVLEIVIVFKAIAGHEEIRAREKYLNPPPTRMCRSKENQRGDKENDAL